MSLASPTRRRLLASVVAAASLAGCSGAPGGTTATDDASEATEITDTDVVDDTAAPDATPSPDPDDGDGTAATDGAATDDPPPNTAATTDGERSTASGDDELDLREANVVGVELAGGGGSTGDGSVRFDVTLYHDDDGESGYADWWQVETLDGARLGRRELLHAHSTAPFTRSETVSIPDGTTHVVVRGHDQTHGYGGQAMVVRVDSGETERVRQGPEPRSFSDFEPSV